MNEQRVEQDLSAGSIPEALMQLIVDPVPYAPSDFRFSARHLSLLCGQPEADFDPPITVDELEEPIEVEEIDLLISVEEPV